MPPDGGSSAATANHDATTDAGPATCAQGISLGGDKAARPLDAAAVARLVKIKDDASAPALARTRATLELADLYRKANHFDEAIALLGPIALADPQLDVGEAAVEPYLDSLRQMKEGCAPELERDAIAIRARYCPPSRRDRFCDGMALISLQLRRDSALHLAQSDPAAAAAAYESLFMDSCLGGGHEDWRCDEIAYNAAISYAGTGEPAKARSVLLLLEDPKNGLTKSPLVPRLECLLAATDAGACR